MALQPSIPLVHRGRSTSTVVCAFGAALVGIVLLLGYVVPNLTGSSLPVFGIAYLAIVAVLSIGGAIGYWIGKKWGWFLQLASVLGQLLFPGTLFEFKLDPYHLVAWVCPVISLVIVIVMGVQIRRDQELA